MFNRDRFGAMAAALAGIKSRLVLSLNDRSEVRETFPAFELRPVELSYGISSGGPTAAREAIIPDGR